MARSEEGHDLALELEQTGAVFDVEWTAPDVSGLVRTELDLDRDLARATVVLRPATGVTVAMIADELALPAPGSALRGPGVWLELICEAPLEHWTVGLEAFGVTVEDTERVRPDTRGDPTPIGLDLDLDTTLAGWSERNGAIRVPVRVRGEVLIGPDRYEIDGPGARWRGGLDLPLDPEPSGTHTRLQLGPGPGPGYVRG
jgi:hypothetical protein